MPQGAVLGFEQTFALEDAIGFHTCSLEASKRVINSIPLGSPLSYRLHCTSCRNTEGKAMQMWLICSWVLVQEWMYGARFSTGIYA